ncbi:hypothetical protein GCM10022377_04470 [Zhihengliuella alba]|uniref:DUF6504 domain-containing protein n=1 Tax=Zhihengliuella alba TaxID=547018 RepID=A0ABP7CU23_9MICC
MGLFTQSLDVVLAEDGALSALTWRGQRYDVLEEPVLWYERRKWWEEEQRAERGRGRGLVDHEIWRVQARGARDGDLRTFDLSHHVASGRWRMIRLHGAVREEAA